MKASRNSMVQKLLESNGDFFEHAPPQVIRAEPKRSLQIVSLPSEPSEKRCKVEPTVKVRLRVQTQDQIMGRRLKTRLTPVSSALFPEFNTVYTYLCQVNKQYSGKELPQEIIHLRKLYSALSNLASFVRFDQENHVYSVRSGSTWIALSFSVTKALELIFESFDADLVAKKVVESQRWKKNALYSQLNFDEAGNPRDSKTVQNLLKNHWKMKRDKGTALHEYIQAQSRGQGTDFVTQFQALPILEEKKTSRTKCCVIPLRSLRYRA